jgi:dihydrofolate reductase
LARADWNNTRLVATDAVEEVRGLKRGEGKDLLIFGSATLADALRRAGLIDEYRLGLNPVVLGAGNPLWLVPSGQPGHPSASGDSSSQPGSRNSDVNSFMV